MKKSRFIMLTLVAALVLMGAGYAAWSQTFTISSTVQTGELFVKIENTGNSVDVLKNGNYTPSSSGADYITFTAAPEEVTDTNGKTTLASFSSAIGNMYPGTKVTSVLKFANLGTLKAKAKLEGSISNTGSQLWNDLVITVNGTPITGSGEAKMNTLASTIAGLVSELEPNGEVTVTIIQELPIDSSNNTENQDLNWRVNFTFEQFNATSN